MTASGYPLDLVALVPGANDEEVLRTLVSSRWRSLDIRENVRYSILRHPRHDAGCRGEAAALLGPFLDKAAHALVLFDHEGSGLESSDPEEIEAEVRNALSHRGWGDRADVVVIRPELEAWVWSDSPHVAKELGWKTGMDDLRAWLEAQGYWPRGREKPENPKAAVESVLWKTRVPRSSAVYGAIARQVSLAECTDRAFLRLRSILSRWFGEEKERR